METAQDVDTREVLACDESFFNALLAADHDSLAAILAGDFLIVDVLGGQVTRREDLLAVIGSGELQFADITRYPRERLVRHRNSVAVVVGRTRMTIRYQAVEATVRSRYTHVYVREDGRWHLMSAQGTPTAG